MQSREVGLIGPYLR